MTFFFFFFFFLLFTFGEKICAPPPLFGAELRHWVWWWLGRYKEPNGDWSIQFVESVIAWFLMCQEILWKTNDTFLMRDRWSDGQSTFHIPHKLHWCKIQNMHACIRHASTFFKSFVYKVHASLCVPQSLRNSAIAFKHTCIKLEQITDLWVIAIKNLCDSICQRCTGLFNFKNPFDWINICEKCRWMKSIIVYMYFLHVIILFFFCTFSHVRKY